MKTLSAALLGASLTVQPAAADDISAAMPFSVSHGAALHNLLGQGVLVEGRNLVHLSHTCNLMIDGQPYPVIDLREIVKGATTPRGVARAVVLDRALRVVNAVEYINARPLFCDGATLYFYDTVEVGDMAEEGNMLTFSEGGTRIEVGFIDANDLPAPLVEDGTLTR